MTFSLIFKSFKFWQLKAEKPLRFIFLLVFALRLGFNLSPYADYDLGGLISRATTALTWERVFGNMGREFWLFALGQTLFMFLMLLMMNLYASVFFYEQRDELIKRQNIPLPLQKPENLIEELRHMQALAKILRLQRGSLQAYGDLWRKQASQASDYVWEDPDQEAKNEGSKLLNLAGISGSEKPWKQAFGRIIKKFFSFLLLFFLLVLISMVSAPLLMIPLFVALSGLAFVGLLFTLTNDTFGEALKRSWAATKGFRLMIFSNFVVLRLLFSLPFSMVLSLFVESPVSYALIEALSYSLSLWIAGRLLGILFVIVAFDSPHVLKRSEAL